MADKLSPTVLAVRDGDPFTRDDLVTLGPVMFPLLPLKPYTVMVRGGYYSQTLADENLLDDYVVHAEDTEDFRGDLSVVVTADPNPPVVGEDVTYTVSITNTGLYTISSLTANYEITSPSAAMVPLDGIMLAGEDVSPAAQTMGSILLSPTSIAPGQVATGTLTKAEDQTGTYVFTVKAYGTALLAGDTYAEGAIELTPLGTEELDPNATDPTLDKQANITEVQPGDPVVWTITIYNGSTSTFTGVVMEDSVPETVPVESVDVSQGAVVSQSNVVTAEIGTLPPGETATVTINTTVDPDVSVPSSIVNAACVTHDGGGQVCQTITINVAPGVDTLPSTGVGLAGWRELVMVASNRRMWIAAGFVLVTLIVIVGAVIVLVSGGEENKSTGETAVPSGPPPEIEPTSPVAMQFPPTPSPYIVSTPAGLRYLIIPKLAAQFQVPVPIVDLPIVDRQWDVSGLGYYIGWLEGTTWMDPDWGNTVLAAHVQLGTNNPGPFWGLNTLEPGDEIIVVEGNIQRRFVVTEKNAVDPSDWTVTAPTNDPTLTLITCTNWDNYYGVFSERMVVRAVPEVTNSQSG